MRSWSAEVTAFVVVVRIEQVSIALPLRSPSPSVTSKQYVVHPKWASVRVACAGLNLYPWHLNSCRDSLFGSGDS
jgi:hypothetical protein